MQKKYSLLAIGEVLIDFIGTQTTSSLLDAHTFQRFQGGSPANLAANMARLGNEIALVSVVGNDNLGEFIKNEIAKTGIDITHFGVSNELPTSIVVVSKTAGTPDFIAYRMADKMIMPNHLPDSLLKETKFIHTTCFALSQNPAQNTLVEAAQRARLFGAKVSIDCNYAPSIWPNRKEAWEVISKYCQHGSFVKLSEDDAERLFDQKLDNQEVISKFHQIGAELVCFTLGGDGAIISYENGQKTHRIFGKKIEVVDATGAGDAFWSGFLTAFLDHKTIPECAEAATKMAILKLGHLGPLPVKVDRDLIY